tara:strand:+ start:4099 stop:4338 length:240 start_codon:yes stop_codon:yes gene_type:complete
MIIKVWRIWKYALGSFEDHKTAEYDNAVCILRSFIFVTYLVTNCFITAGVIRHWGDGQETVTLSPDIPYNSAIVSTYKG